MSRGDRPAEETPSEKAATKKGTKEKIALTMLMAVAGAILATACFALNPSPQQVNDLPQGEVPILTEFGDFQCPHCASFAQTVLPRLERDLVNPGIVRFEYRHYPFLGKESFTAAEASECAREQNKFREYHDGLLQLTAMGRKLTLERLAETARDLELEQAGFNRCLQSNEKRAAVMEDREYGRALGVRGRPPSF